MIELDYLGCRGFDGGNFFFLGFHQLWLHRRRFLEGCLGRNGCHIVFAGGLLGSNRGHIVVRHIGSISALASSCGTMSFGFLVSEGCL